ncbi:MAG TPA: hypothetical protein VGL89_01015 [Candidatus Koribacter sp.]|jgi:hypothetical protein
MKVLIASALLAALVLPVAAQQRPGHDPLTADESDKLRDTAMEPNRRLKLYVEFAKARMVKIDALLADPKAKDRPQQLHDLLADFSSLADEIADNVDTFSSQQWDIRKSLKLVIEADSGFRVELRNLAQQAAKNEDEAQPYKFVLQDTIESVNNGADDARKTMQDQNALAKDKKLKKEDDSQQ